MAPSSPHTIPTTDHEARLLARNNTWNAPTCGIAPTHLQANLLVLPSKYASDFQTLCTRNPVPCPLLARSASAGDFTTLISYIPGIPPTKIAHEIDIRTDAPRYNVYINGNLTTEEAVPDIKAHWSEDHVAFLIGCSYSFESALTAAGLIPAHVQHGRNVPMYRTKIPLCPAGVFQGSTYVVSMRMYRAGEVERVREVTRPYMATHGEPMAWGWEGMRAIGVEDISAPEWGDVPVTPEGKLVVPTEGGCLSGDDSYVPVFWGCGVTPQEAVMRAKIPGTVMGHAPGYMIVLDVTETDILDRS